MSNSKAPRWYARFMANESMGDIAASENVSRNTVVGTLDRYIRANGLPRRPGKAKTAPTEPPARIERLIPVASSVTCQARRDLLDRIQHPDPPQTFSEALDRHSCKSITGDLMEGTARFCGGERVPGKPYCEDHCRVYYVRTRSRSRALAGTFSG